MYGHLNRFSPSSRIFTPMPLYHSTAALLAIGVGWHTGATVIIGRKFSASTFWKDVRDHDANVIQYVGEVLRYLLAVPPSPLDKQHKVTQAYGNGCRPDVWEKFRGESHTLVYKHPSRTDTCIGLLYCRALWCSGYLGVLRVIGGQWFAVQLQQQRFGRGSCRSGRVARYLGTPQEADHCQS